jgi:glyoxylase-like metal-dependent hydrolase (beta-lactamase superfamily II)
LLERFGKATIVIQQKELAYHLNPPHPWFSQFTVMPILHKINTEWKHRLRVVCGDAHIIPGISVLCTGGHSPGLQSVQVQTAAGPVAITSDVVFFYENLQRDIPVGFVVNVEECYRAMARFRAEFGLDRVIPSHDPLVLQRWGEAR